MSKFKVVRYWVLGTSGDGQTVYTDLTSNPPALKLRRAGW